MTTTTPTPRILVVDDDRAVRTAIRVNLSKQGWDVSVAEDAEGALKLIAERPVDLVLTDVAMPGRSGMDLLAAYARASPRCGSS
jgi:DNA-binding NtrC family response regulator